MPRGQNVAADIVAGFGEETAAGLRLAFGERKPVAPLLSEPIDTKPPEQYVVGARVFGVQFQTIALEPLHLEQLPFDLFILLWGDRQAKHWQPTVLLPECTDAAGDAEARLGEATLAGLRSRLRWQAH